MAGQDLLELLLTVESVLLLVLMVFNTYFLVSRPIYVRLREIYFLNGPRFRIAWYLVISATTLFSSERVLNFSAETDTLPSNPAAVTSTILQIAFSTLLIVAFTMTFAVFTRYVRTLPPDDQDVDRRLSAHMRDSVLRDDYRLDVDIDLTGAGDITTARARLGPWVSLSHYRAMKIGFAAYMEQKLGHMGDAILYAVGRLTARAATTRVMGKEEDPERTLLAMFDEIRDAGIALPQIRTRSDELTVITLHENAPAAGVEPSGRPICHYQSGMLAGIMEVVSGRPTRSTETRCWGLGHDLCEFEIRLDPEPPQNT